MLLRMEVSDAEIAAARAAGPPHADLALDATQPLVTLLEALTKQTDRRYVYLQKGDLSLTLAQRASS
jgi:hypothetical protein